jgi:hypothetical protein
MTPHTEDGAARESRMKLLARFGAVWTIGKEATLEGRPDLDTAKCR